MIASDMSTAPKATKTTKTAKPKGKAAETTEQYLRRQHAEAKREVMNSEAYLTKIGDLIEAAKLARSAAEDLAYSLHQHPDFPPPKNPLSTILMVENADFYKQVVAFQAMAETVLDWVQRGIPADVIVAATGDSMFDEWD